MGFNCGIVGLPNVGKSTIFNALTNAGAQAANYPFCTINPNVGVVFVPDNRLQKLAEIFEAEKVTPTTVEFVDIAGLVEGASKGEGLGNQFLGHIREVDAIAHIVRCFDDPDVVHVHGGLDPIRDIEVIHTELLLADHQAVTKQIDKIKRLAKVGNKTAAEDLHLYEKIGNTLNEGKQARSLSLNAEECEKLKPLFLISMKPELYVCNVDEDHVLIQTDVVKKVQDKASQDGADVVVICGKIESEIAQMNEAEKGAFLADYGLKEAGLCRLAQAGYHLLNLITFLTAGPKEVRAWTVAKGSLAPKAAGQIHSDFEKGFIRAEVYHYNDLIRLGSEQKVREAGLLRSEGKEYVVKDGDVMLFRFNV